jgi:hypothetical protein
LTGSCRSVPAIRPVRPCDRAVRQPSSPTCAGVGPVRRSGRAPGEHFPAPGGSELRTDGGPVPRRCAPHAGCDVPSGNLAAPSGHVAQRPRPGRSRNSRFVGVRGRAGFPADHRPATARRPSPLPSCRFPFPVRLQGVPTDACQRVSEPASASPPSLRVRRARRGAEPPEARDPRERGPADLAWSCLPRTRSFEVPSSGMPAAVHSRHTPRRHEQVHDDGQRAFGPWLPSHSVLFRPRGFSPPRRFSPHRGVRACCVPVPDMGFAAFHVHQATETEVSRRVAGRLRSRRRGSRPGSSQRRPFEGLILVGSRSASLRSLPPRRLVRPFLPPRTADKEWAAVPTGPRRTRPHGRSLRVQRQRRGGVCRSFR